MILGIDASNITGGGGWTHLRQLVDAADPEAHGFEKVVVWASLKTQSQLANRPWLVKRHFSVMEARYFRRAVWQSTRLQEQAQAEGCDLLFIPGGSFNTKFRPIVTMSRNMLPFEWSEMKRYGISPTTLKYSVLRWTQSRSFRNADGTIFLTDYARNAVSNVAGKMRGATRVIPHGIETCFFNPPRAQKPISEYSVEHPMRLLYVSKLDLYKHQWSVGDAVAQLKRDGLPIVIDLVGPSDRRAFRRLKKRLRKVDPGRNAVYYKGEIAHDHLCECYAKADAYVFGSTCENMPNILLEAMASGLPIACSDRGPMPEVLADGGVFFNPENAASIREAIRALVVSPRLREEKALKAFERARNYSWKRCADETFEFLGEVASRSRVK